jgi:hypothetical protein
MRRGLYNHLGIVKDQAAQQTFRLMQERLTSLDDRLATDADDLIRIASEMDRVNTIQKVCGRIQAQQITSSPPGTFIPGEGIRRIFDFPETTFGGCTSDQISPGSVSWLHDNASSWPKTSTLNSISIGPNSVKFPHSKAGQWPTFTVNSTLLEGNPWFFANIGGQWYGATWEWLRPGQTSKSISPDAYGPHIKRSPMSTWIPSPGEQVGFMVSTRARDGVSSGDERTAICTFNFPQYTIEEIGIPDDDSSNPAGRGGCGGGAQQAPNGLPIVQQCANNFPTEWANAHKNYPTPPGPERDAAEAFIRRLVPKLRSQINTNFYLNVKQNQSNGRISQDAIAYWAPGMSVKEVYDVIGGAGGPNPRAQWACVDTGPPEDISLV